MDANGTQYMREKRMNGNAELQCKHWNDSEEYNIVYKNPWANKINTKWYTFTRTNDICQVMSKWSIDFMKE